MNRLVKRLLILFADTGGGHRSSAWAVAQALRDCYDGQVQVDLVNVLADYAPWPFNHLDRLYRHMVRLKVGWAVGYRLSDGPRRVNFIAQACWPWVHAALQRLFREHAADVILSCHPLFNHLTLCAVPQQETPLLTLVTDLATAHAFWFAPDVSLCLVPTEGGRRQALLNGLSAEQVIETGLPVEQRFVAAAQKDQQAMRCRLGLDVRRPMVLLTCGAEGIGAMHRLCSAIASSGAQIQLAVIAGRNERLRGRLHSETWPLPMRVEGFVDNMHEWMRAADLLITKAGPSTISEALVMGLPMVITDALPGQERPNVDYVMAAGAGVWAPTPERVVTEVSDLLTSDQARLYAMAKRAQSLARPGAAQRVAEIVWAVANGEPCCNLAST